MNNADKQLVRKQRKEKRDAKLAAMTNKRKRKGTTVSNGKHENSTAKKAKVDVKPNEKQTKLAKKTGDKVLNSNGKSKVAKKVK